MSWFVQKNWQGGLLAQSVPVQRHWHKLMPLCCLKLLMDGRSAMRPSVDSIDLLAPTQQHVCAGSDRLCCTECGVENAVHHIGTVARLAGDKV